MRVERPIQSNCVNNSLKMFRVQQRNVRLHPKPPYGVNDQAEILKKSLKTIMR